MPVTAPTQDTAPVAASVAGKWSFTSPVEEQIVLHNDSVGATVNVQLYATAGEFTSVGAASATVYQLAIPDGACIYGKPDEFGLNQVAVVSAWVEGGTVGNFRLGGR